MSSAQQSVDVGVDVMIAYAQWARFDSFPQWMEGVASIEDLGDGRLHWVAKVKDEVATAENEIREWDARITEQIPDRCISWESVGGRPEEKPNAGRVTFEPLGTSACRLTFRIEWEPEAGLEVHEAYMLDAVNQMLAADLARFKDLIEARATRTRTGGRELAA